MIYYCLNCSITIEGQRRKYCSKKCKKRYGCSKSATDLSKKEVGNLLGISRQFFNEIIKTYNIKLEKTVTGKSTYLTQETFQYIKNNLEKFKQELRPTSIPDGWDGYEDIANKLGKEYAHNTSAGGSIHSLFKRHGEPGKSRNIILCKPGAESNPPTKIWRSTDVDAWVIYYKNKKEEEKKQLEIEKEQAIAKRQEFLENRKLAFKEMQELKKRQKLEKIAEEEKQFLEQTKDLIISKEAASLLEYKCATPFLLNKLYKLPSTKKVKGKFYFKPSEVLELKEYLEKEKLEQQEKSKKRLERKRPRLAKDWTTDEAYERRLWKKIQSLGMPKNLNEKQQQRWLNNKRLMKNGQLGIIKTFKCNICDKELPYTSFYCEFNRGNKDGREYRCKNCQNSNKKRINAKKPKTATTFATQFTTSIKQELSRQNGYYIEISVKEIWENMPYTKEEFITNIESKFAPWMTWDLNGRPSKSQKKAWQLDHVKPRASFLYKNMQDPQFIECWSLNNLQPLEARMNILKSNKDLMQKCCWQFRKGLIDINYNKGIWQHLPYTPVQAREELEKKHGQEIDWNRFKGSKLHIDHVIPQAKLGFNSFEDKNFCECWKLDNLQILLHNNNSSKGSRYKGKIWFHNKT